MRVFLSYRRDDVGAHAGWLADALVQRLGPKSVFYDVSTIVPGEDFTTAIDRALATCDVVLAVIGPGWLAASDARGRPRLHQPQDYVRLELSRALERGHRVVPVLVGGAELPAAENLPEDLHGLVRRQAVALRDGSWHGDVDHLVRSLRGEAATSTSARGRRWWVAAAAAVALVAAVPLVRAGVGGGDGEESDGGPPPCAPPEGEGWTALTLDQSATGVSEDEDGAGSIRFTVTDAVARPAGGGWEVMLETDLTNESRADAVSHGYWDYEHLVVGQRPFPPTCFSPDEGVVDPDTKDHALVGFQVTCEPVGYLQLRVTGSRIDVTDDPEWGPC